MSNLVLENPVAKESFDQEAIFNFLDHTVLLITQAKNAEDIDLLMDDFMSDDIMLTLEEHKELFSLLNVVWFSAFKRIFIDERSDSFPLKVLWLPVMFKKLDWEIEDIATFEEANFSFRMRNQQSNDIYKHLVELFLNGLKFELDTAFKLFKDQVTTLELANEDDQESIDTMLEDIASLGW